MAIAFARDFNISLRAPLSAAFESGAAAIIGGFAAYGTLAFMGELVDIDTFLGIFAQGLMGGIVGVVSTGFVLWLLKSEELIETLKALKRLRAKEDAVAVPPSELSS